MTDGKIHENGRCDECGVELGVGYLCDGCDEAVVHD